MDTTRELDGRYRLRERLGAGGMSVVWRAEDRVLGRDVAVKLLGADFAATARDRVRAEARAVARLAHPHIAAVYDYGEVPGDDGRPVPYVVMELVPGRSLAQALAGGPLPWRRAVAVAAEVADALVAAHRAGVVHRDITPANILLGANGVKVVDFGIAAAIGEPETGAPLGTPAYLAPERLEGRGAQPATDVYALGLLLYQALAGSLPWPAATTTDMLRAHRYVAPAPLPPVPGLPAEVAELCAACLAKDPDRRPGAPAVAARLAALVGGNTTALIAAGALPERPAGPAAPGRTGVPAGLSATRALPADERPGAFPAGVAAVPARPAPPGDPPHHGGPYAGGPPGRARRRLLAGLAALALVAIGLGGVAMLAGRGSGGTPAGAPSAASTTPAATGATAAACTVDVRTAVDRGRAVTTLTVTNTGPAALDGWTLTFRSKDKLDGTPGQWSRDGDRFTVRSADGLGPGDSVTLRAAGGGHGKHAAQVDGFALDGVGCAASGDGAAGTDGGDGKGNGGDG